MKAAEVIVRMGYVAPRLSNTGVRLMVHVLATGYRTGSNRVQLTSRSAAAGIGTSQDGIAKGIRDLARFMKAETKSRQFTLFELDDDWFDPQMRLALDCGNPVDGSFSAWESQARCLEKQGTTDERNGGRAPETQARCLENPGTLPGKPRHGKRFAYKERGRARGRARRIESNRIRSSEI